MKILGISGTIVGSKTKIAVEKVLEAIKELDSNIEVELVDLKEYDVQFCDGRDPKTYMGDTKKVIDIVSSADSYIIGTPIFHGTMPGTLKNLFDLLPVEVMNHKVIGFVAVGGNHQHYLMIENQLKPIAGYFKSFVAPNYVFVHNNHFQDNKLVNNDILKEIARLSKEVVMMQKMTTT
ncbi:NADPH-dependent FMN reductase [Bacillus massiliigorillae]|uniref:NADPH-dependent FMN reductase n=1 Tax=Bacillus massiliigorillae TaxID=1243664 RepID=UPI0003A281B0|nr:NAD(P)H-dependent oxidoreductase [Bacillus massiliigorillae]